MLIDAVKRCYASLFTDRAIVYRVHRGFDHSQVALSVGVQKMVRSDLACAGVMFSIDTETGFSNAVLVNGAYGLGESVVQGTVNPDESYVFKPTLAKGFRPILQKKLGTKEFKLIGAAHAGGRKIGICGQAPSDYPDFAQFLVTEGIDSLSLNADSQLKTMLAIVDLEKRLAQGVPETAGVGTQASR